MDGRDGDVGFRVAAAGAVGGLWLAVGDLGASALWIEAPAERAVLVVHLAGVLVPPAMALALIVWKLDALGLRLAETRPRLRPLPIVLAAAPFVLALAIDAFSGARISRVPGVRVWMAAAAAVGLTCVWLARGAVAHVPRLSGRRAFIVGGVLFALASAGVKANQLLYPRHYDSIHGALAVVTGALASIAAWIVLAERLPRWRAWPLVITAGAVFASTLASIAYDHDGRAALLSPRAVAARSVILAVPPSLYAWGRETSDAAAVEAARRRRAGPRGGEGLVWGDAHLVLITVDALRADHLGAYGYARRTTDGRGLSARMDRLAREGVLFEHAWAATPRSSYSICSFMTGWALHARAAPRHSTLAEELNEAGYYTAGFYSDGIFFHEGERLAAYRDAELGFVRRDGEYRDAASRTDAVLEEVNDLRRRGEPRAFFWVHYFDVHEPYEERALGDTPVDRYDGEILNVDRSIERLLAGMEALERPLIVVLSADHGEEHLDHGGRFHGGSLYEEQLRVPLIIQAPGLTPRRVSQPVSLVDLAPTLRALLALPSRTGDGFDLRPLFGSAEARRPAVRATERGMAAVLAWPHKLIESRRTASLEVFDLSADPGERNSLASERPDLVRALRAELAAFNP